VHRGDKQTRKTGLGAGSPWHDVPVRMQIEGARPNMTTPSNRIPNGDESWSAPASTPPSEGGWGPPATPVTPGYGPGGPTQGYGQTYGMPPGAGAGQYDSPTATGQVPRGPYRPPAHQPGIIPLRPIGLGEILDGAFRAIRHNPRAMFGLSAMVVAATGAIQALVIWVGLSWFSSDWLTAGTSANSDASVGAIAGTIVPSVIGGIVFGITTTLLIGLLIVAVSRSVLGNRMTIGEIWQHARPQLWRLLVVTVLVSILVGLVGALWVGGMVWAAVANQYAVLAIVAVVGGIGTLGWTGWMTVRTLLATPALMLEQLHVLESVRRSFRLTRGSFWRLLGIYLLTSILVGVVAQVVSVPITIVSSLLLVTMSGEAAVLAITTALSSIVAALITTPFSAAVVALLYIDTRMRREGLDVQLVRAAQEQAA